MEQITHFPLFVDEIDDTGVVDNVPQGRFGRYLFIRRIIGVDHFIDLCFGPRQTHGVNVEISQILPQPSRGIVLWINRYENGHYLLTSCAKEGPSPSQFGKCQWANTRTRGITKKQKNDFAPVIPEMENLSVILRKGKIPGRIKCLFKPGRDWLYGGIGPIETQDDQQDCSSG